MYSLLDHVSHRYGKLPSELIDSGDTLDIEIFLASSNLQERQRKLQKGESIGDTYSQDKLKEMLDNTRNIG